MHEKDQKIQEKSNDPDTVPLTELKIQIRDDLYRAFRRCVWMIIHETGLTQIEVHNMLIEELLKRKKC